MKMWKVVVILVVFVYLLVGIYISLKRQKEIIKNFEFKGVVENVRYEKKGIPYVTVNSKTYYLSYNNWSLKRSIQKGDFIIKEKGALSITVIKKNSGEKLTFD